MIWKKRKLKQTRKRWKTERVKRWERHVQDRLRFRKRERCETSRTGEWKKEKLRD